MDLQKFKMQFWNTALNYNAKRNRYFDVDDYNKDFLDLICRYFCQDKSFEELTSGELRKGLLIYGNCGTGKSSVFDIVREIVFKNKFNPFYFKNVSVHSVINEFNVQNHTNIKFGESVVEKYCRGIIHFDDVGAETKVQAWGIKEELFDRILQQRYNKFKDKGIRTFITTNLTIDDLERRYSPQVKSRIHEMFNFLELSGPDRRF